MPAKLHTHGFHIHPRVPATATGGLDYIERGGRVGGGVIRQECLVRFTNTLHPSIHPSIQWPRSTSPTAAGEVRLPTRGTMPPPTQASHHGEEPKGHGRLILVFVWPQRPLTARRVESDSTRSKGYPAVVDSSHPHTTTPYPITVLFCFSHMIPYFPQSSISTIPIPPRNTHANSADICRA